MGSTVGIFTSRINAERAIEHLQSVGIPPDRISLLSPGASNEGIHDIPTTDTEQPGMGKALGGVVGGVLGMQAGAALSVVIPGIGPVVATGLVAIGLLGAIGVIGGAVAGEALEAPTVHGLPVDELYLYEDALRQGRTILFVLADTQEEVDAARKIMANAGAESLDAARKTWWVGLRGAEEVEYAGQGGDFTADEPNYRRGFEAALSVQARGKSYEEALSYLQERYPDVYDRIPFRRGYERGHAFHQELTRRNV